MTADSYGIITPHGLPATSLTTLAANDHLTHPPASTPTTATLHVVRLHHAAPERSSDCGGNGPLLSLTNFLELCHDPMETALYTSSLPLLLLADHATLDISVPTLHQIAACLAAHGRWTISLPTTPAASSPLCTIYSPLTALAACSMSMHSSAWLLWLHCHAPVVQC